MASSYQARQTHCGFLAWWTMRPNSRRQSMQKEVNNMNIYHRLGKQLENIADSITNVYRDGKPFELLKAQMLGIMQELESYEPIAASFEEVSENFEE